MPITDDVPLPEQAAYYWAPTRQSGIASAAAGWSANVGPHPDWHITRYYTADQVRAYGDARAAAAVKAKREQCARICDDMTLYTGLDCAEAIRKGE